MFMCKNKVKTSRFLILLLIVCAISSCENTESPLLPEKIALTAELGNNDGTKPLYVYGPREFDFSVNTDKGVVELVQIFYQDVEINSFTGQSGRFLFTPDKSKKEATNLKMKITVAVEQEKYYETVNYSMQYVSISEEDFELIDATIDRFVFRMRGEKLENYNFMYIGTTYDNPDIIDDLDNIVIKRNPLYKFPIEYHVIIFLVPKEQMYNETGSYVSVKLDLKDKKLGNFHPGNTLFHYVDCKNEEMYVWSQGELSVFDKNMNEIKHRPIEDIHSLLVTPKTGRVVVKPIFGKLVTYSDNNFNTIISEIDPEGYIGAFAVNERDQLFNSQNFNIDVYDLNTGESIYSLNFHNFVRGFTLSGDKLVVDLGNDEETLVYQLDENSATYLYTFKKAYMGLGAHPININHIILNNTYIGFEIFDLEARTSIYSNKGQIQSIDPISGSILYYGEKYSYTNNVYDNHVIDLNYNEILVFEDDSQSNGAFLQFNNYVIKEDRYVNLLSNGK